MPKPHEKKSFLLRLPPRLFDELRRWAEQDMRSINGQIEWILRDAVQDRGKPAATQETADDDQLPPD